jgi:hypothetical protein
MLYVCLESLVKEGINHGFGDRGAGPDEEAEYILICYRLSLSKFLVSKTCVKLSSLFVYALQVLPHHTDA